MKPNLASRVRKSCVCFHSVNPFSRTAISSLWKEKKRQCQPRLDVCFFPHSGGIILSQKHPKQQGLSRWPPVLCSKDETLPKGGLCFFFFPFSIHVLSPVNLFSSPASFVSCIPVRKTAEAATLVRGIQNTQEWPPTKRRLREASCVRLSWRCGLPEQRFCHGRFLHVLPALRSFVWSMEQCSAQNTSMNTHANKCANKMSWISQADGGKEVFAHAVRLLRSGRTCKEVNECGLLPSAMALPPPPRHFALFLYLTLSLTPCRRQLVLCVCVLRI